MPDAGTLAEILLNQSPACHCVVRAKRLRARRSKGLPTYGEFAFEKVWGDSVPLFGKVCEELTGAACSTVLSAERARSWSGRFERVFEGDSLLLRERSGKAVWYVSVFPMRP